ncbi:integrase, catalytic region, zinc finger, CCHC-type containing protein [Tanacetum coccineum]|uniref:Integrase, catalytic region, zinc finger, CCHC-type containing protein n=1 Tax=Tanacetum coccineum TaxID=301880 RepID=A0ABQ5FJ97_9ASTR
MGYQKTLNLSSNNYKKNVGVGGSRSLGGSSGLSSNTYKQKTSVCAGISARSGGSSSLSTNGYKKMQLLFRQLRVCYLIVKDFELLVKLDFFDQCAPALKEGLACALECILVTASEALTHPTHLRLNSEHNSADVEFLAAMLAKSFVPLSVICRNGLPKMQDIYTAGNNFNQTYGDFAIEFEHPKLEKDHEHKFPGRQRERIWPNLICDDPIDVINHMMSLLTVVITSRYPTTNNQLRNSSNPRQQATINDGRVMLQPIQGRHTYFDTGTTRTYTPGASGSNSEKQMTVICYNCKGEGHMSKQCTKPKRKRDDSWFKDKVLLVQVQANGQILHEEELAFLTDPRIAKVALMENLSYYGLDALAEVHNHDNVNNNMINQAVQAMPSSEYFIVLYFAFLKNMYIVMFDDDIEQSHLSEPPDKIIKSISANNKEPSKSWGSIVSDVPSSSLDECTVKFGNDHVTKILGYGDYQIGNVTILRVYYVEGLGHNLFFVRQFYDSNLEVAFRQHTYFIHNLEVMASEHSSLEPAFHEMTPTTISSGLMPNTPPSTPYVPHSRTDWNILFQPLFDELLNPQPSVDLPAPKVIAPIAEVVALEPDASTGSPSSTTVDQDAPSPRKIINFTQTSSPSFLNNLKQKITT